MYHSRTLGSKEPMVVTEFNTWATETVGARTGVRKGSG